MDKPIRAFIAFDLPEGIVQLAAGLQTRLKQQGLKLRWVKPTSIHLTLKFLGPIPFHQVDPIAAAVRAVARAKTPLTLTARGLGVFPNPRNARVLWMGLDGQTDALRQVHEHLEQRLASLGFVPESRPFKSHLTLARIPDVRDHGQWLQDGIRTAGGFAPRTFQVSDLILFKSELRPQGAVYTPLAHARMGRP